MDYDVEKREIVIDRELSNLDKFAVDFCNIVSRHVPYVIIAGYISILLGRTRTTEDIDVFIKEISEGKFFELYEDLERNGFWAINSDDPKRLFEYLKSKIAIRFSRKDNPIPNFEVKFPKDELDESVFEDFIKVILPKDNLLVSSLERHIAFKRWFLGSGKDVYDADHVENLFKEKLDYGKINKIKELIERRKEWGY
jgi:hypothetical protein